MTKLTKDQKYVLLILVAVLVFIGETMSLAIQNWVGSTPTERFALYFWLGLVWSFVPGGLLFVRIRRHDLWARFHDAEISLRKRFGLRVNGWAYRFVESRAFVIFNIVVLIAYVITTALSAAAYFFFTHQAG